jgi:hypothetical protein
MTPNDQTSARIATGASGAGGPASDRPRGMNVRKVIEAHLRRHLQRLDVAADVNGVIDANVLSRRHRTAGQRPRP